MSKHTPGPWETGEASWNEDGEVRYTIHGVRSANVADCRLIAAAPELLEALEAVLHDFEDLDMVPSNEHGRSSTAFELAVAAIAKSRGEA